MEENSFEEKESLDKLISIGEKSRVSVGNESSTVFCIAKTSTLNICYLSSLSGLSMLCRGSNLLYNLTIVMLTATFCRAALSHMFVIRPNIADLGFSQVFAKGRTT